MPIPNMIINAIHFTCERFKSFSLGISLTCIINQLQFTHKSDVTVLVVKSYHMKCLIEFLYHKHNLVFK